MSARLRLGKFLSSPVCRIYGDRDIPEAEAETFQLGLGQEQTDRQIIQNFRSEIILTKKIMSGKGCRQKKHSIFKDIAQIEGREVNPISKKLTEMIF